MYKYRKKGEKRKQRGNYRFYNNLNDYITYMQYKHSRLRESRMSLETFVLKAMTSSVDLMSSLREF